MRTAIAVVIDSRRDCLDVYERELGYLYETLRRLGVRAPDIDDVAQEIFVVLQRNWPELDVSYPLRPYLSAVAFRLASAHRRRRAREIPYAHLDAEDETAGPEEAFQSAESAQLLLMALRRLPAKRRAVVLMHDLDGHPIVDVAARLSLTRFGAYARLRKARKELASAMRRLARPRVRR